MQVQDIQFKTKYELVRNLIRGEISTKHGGDKLSTEWEMARRYGVNRGTINKVLSSLSSEGLVTRKPRVGSIVLKPMARRLHHRLGVLVERGGGHVFGNLSQLLRKAIQHNHYFPLHIDIAPYNAENELRDFLTQYWEEIVASMPEFFVLDGQPGFPFDIMKRSMSRINHLIVVNRFESDVRLSGTYILSDYEKGGYLGARHLLEGGHDNILVITYPRYVFPCASLCELRIRGVQRAFRERGLTWNEAYQIGTEGCDEPALRSQLQKLFAAHRRPTAIFAMSDFLARRIQVQLSRLGFAVGVDYHLLGYFDTPHATDGEPALSSISINEQGIADALDAILKDGQFKKERIYIDPCLMVRASTATALGTKDTRIGATGYKLPVNRKK